MNRNQQILDALIRSHTIALTTHERPDGDALGSLTAMQSFLLDLGKNVVSVVEDRGPQCYNFLPGIDRIKIPGDFAEPIQADLVVVLDCAMVPRVGAGVERLLPKAPRINIDHHYSNTNFGDINWVDDDYSCVGEMVYSFAVEAGWQINKGEAISLYTAICTDTGRFSYANTNARVLRIAAELVERGAEPRDVFLYVYMEKEWPELLLHGRAYASLQTASNGRVAWSMLRNNDFEETHSTPVMTQDMVNIPRSLKGVQIAVLFYEKGDGEIKMSFRAREPYDANVLAGYFGGGGHRRASGATVTGDLDEVAARVIARAEQMIAAAKPEEQ